MNEAATAALGKLLESVEGDIQAARNADPGTGDIHFRLAALRLSSARALVDGVTLERDDG